jgi:molybdopterin synthase catalytic subunit/molybdopterin converting factor small subunit
VTIRVLFFGQLKDVAGCASDTVELAKGATIADLLAHYEKKIPRLKEFLPSTAISLNQVYASPTAKLMDNDEVALLPPVSGGTGKRHAGELAKRRRHVAIVRERIDPHQFVPALERPEDGAIVMFDGIVRDHSRDRRTLHLEYEAYEEMALRELRALAEDAVERFAIRDVALVHRLGRLEIGESSVFIAVFSEHRADAFAACRFLIDTLKRTVPIWKKEYFEDGPVWADGEPFPAEIPAAAPPVARKAASKTTGRS